MKPSLKKKGKGEEEIIQELSEKYRQNMKLLKIYGVDLHNDSIELSDVKCQISSVSSEEQKEITNKIFKDWDRKHHNNIKPEILGVYQVSGLPVEEDYNKIKEQNEKKYKGNTRLFYHGTGSFATSLILGHSGGFKLVKAKVGRMLGDGIYLADKPSKSAQYISDQGFTRHGAEGSLMVCEASLGKIGDLNQPKIDTVEAIAGKGIYAGLINNEWCVKNPNAVLPRYLVHMKIR